MIRTLAMAAALALCAGAAQAALVGNAITFNAITFNSLTQNGAAISGADNPAVFSGARVIGVELPESAD